MRKTQLSNCEIFDFRISNLNFESFFFLSLIETFLTNLD